MNYFSETYGIVTKHDPTTENGGLFLAHYFVLKKYLGLKVELIERDTFYEKMSRAWESRGLYKRSSEHSNRTVSHDEISGFMICSHILGTWHGEEILCFLKKNFGNYPATGKNKFYQPSDYYAWNLLCDSKWSFLFAPFYKISLMISSNKSKGKTSSKLIYFDELFLIKEKSWYANILWKYFSWRMEKMYGRLWVKELFEIYFQTEDEDHPLLILSRGIE